MADQMTTTESLGGSMGNDADTAVTDAVEALRQAMVDRGDDPGQVEAQLSAVIPRQNNLVGNFADLQRMGAIATTGEMPTSPGEDNLETSDLSEAFLEPTPPGGGPSSVTAPNVADEGATGYDSWTKAELQAELDSQGIEYSTAETKADLVAKLG